MKNLSLILLLLIIQIGYSQNNNMFIIAKLNTSNKSLIIRQEITYYNQSKDTLNNIYLHNWINSYKNKKTPLTKRLLEDYDKSLYFAKETDKGFSKIKLITNNKTKNALNYQINNYDIVNIELKHKLTPKDSITFTVDYIVKIPKSTFTKYGYSKNVINLRYWYLTPAVYTNKWELMSNYNMDDIYSHPTDYKIEFTIPTSLNLESTLNITKRTTKTKEKTYVLKGEKQVDIEIIIEKKLSYKTYNYKDLKLTTNLTNSKIEDSLSLIIINRQLKFIESFLGKYPHKKLLVNKISYTKNPVYGLNQLPSILNPFNDIFKFDIRLFKAVTNKYINSSLLINKRTDYWFNDGLQTFIMLKYVEKYYPEVKSMGAISRIWGVRSYELAKLSFNDKYAFVHQFAMRKNLDQSLSTRSDSLSTFNRKIVNKYKAGLGLIYLNDYLEKDVIRNSIKTYYRTNLLLTTKKRSFKEIINSKTKKDVSWFFKDYLQTNKKIDYTIKKVKIHNDSLIIGIKNKSDFTAPITIYGIKNKEIKYRKWITNISDFSNITIPKGDFDRVSLNYEYKYPEINLNNNWKKIKSSFLNRPLQLRFLKDVSNPYYNQIFYNIEYDYNYYDGVILGLRLGNQTLVKKKWTYNIKPTFGFKSNELKGSFDIYYTSFPKYNSIYKFKSGITYSNYNYAANLTYQRISPFITIDFKRKSLRDVGGKYFSARHLTIKKEIAKDSISLESDNYSVFNLRYGMYKPNIIKNIKYVTDFQLSNNFSKLSFEVEYRKLRKNNSQIDFRLYVGNFLFNKTTTSFFDFSLNRPSDYLFDYNYFGRSEDSGFLSQQIIISEGGFKSFFKENTANQWMISSNNSIGLWRWIEIYGDIGLFKNKYQSPIIKYDSGIRFNFVQNFFEIYFPLQSSNGLEIKQPKYTEKIRFVATLSIGKIYNFIKKGFY